MIRKRRLVLFLDGTWNEDADYDQDTNVVRLRDLISRGITDRSRFAQTLEELDQDDGAVLDIEARPWGDFDYIFFYERGVGTGPGLDRLSGGALGWGLSTNVRRAYKFISRYYTPGSQIHIFGFSRGAYTARSLVGYLGSAGLLRPECCTVEKEQQAWTYYRTTPNDRLPGLLKTLEPFTFVQPRVHCLGLFDTVGTLGVPTSNFRRFNRQWYEFHDVGLSPIVKLNLHALAIDERRSQFGASVWRQNMFKISNSVTEQTWFPGVHADVGGGYFMDQQRFASDTRELDDITLDWMLKRIRFHYPDFPILDTGFTAIHSVPKKQAAQHESRTWKYRLSPPAIRTIGNLRPPELIGELIVSHDRDEAVVGESIHISALNRLGQQVPLAGVNRRKYYLPRNLIENVPNLYAHYCLPHDRPFGPEAISITAWDGEILRPAVGYDDKLASKDESLANARVALEGACARMKALGFDVLSESWSSTESARELANRGA
jgi:hypothetical protein